METPAGNLLWDCLGLVDAATVAAVEAKGGLAAIAVSHPHFYGSCVEWSEAFGGVPIWLHAADAEWVMRPSPSVVAWSEDEAEPVPGLRLLRLPAHFDGAAVCHWPAGAGGRGALLSGDTVQVVSDTRWVSVMWSFPNFIPVPAETALDVARRLSGLEFERVYGAFPGRTVEVDGAAAVARSMARYAERVTSGPGPSLRPRT